MGKKESDTTFLLRIDKDLKINAEYVAKKSERSLNWYINNLIKNDISKK
jgi:predicted HicB family RNase H-like nuclease